MKSETLFNDFFHNSLTLLEKEQFIDNYFSNINSKNKIENVNDETFLIFMLLKELLTKESVIYLKCIDILYDKITKDTSYIDSSSFKEKGLLNEECVRILNSLYFICKISLLKLIFKK